MATFLQNLIQNSMARQDTPFSFPTMQPQQMPQQAPQQSYLMQLVNDLQNNPLIQQQDANKQAEHIAKVYAANPDFANKYYSTLKSLSGNSSEAPSNVREYQFVQSLPPEERENYLRIKRAQQNIDLGGYYGYTDPVTGQVVPLANKTLPPSDLPTVRGEQAQAAEAGKLSAEKQAAYPKVEGQVDTTISIIDDALKHPGFDANFGMTGMFPNIPGGAAADAKTYLDQIKGTAFLTAIGELKGSGAVSEKEGDAATAAVARLSSAQSPESARKALNDLKQILNRAKKRAAAGTTYQASEELAQLPEASGAASSVPMALPNVFEPSNVSPNGVVDYTEYFK